MKPRTIFAICCAKIAAVCIKILQIGEGATWPGEIAIRIAPDILKEITKKDIEIIVVAGTNGKTTTAKMIETVVASKKRRVVRNESGANLDNGIVSTFIQDMLVPGKLQSTCFIFEIDEATVPNILLSLHPNVIVLLNLFRDQLDRYGEVDVIVEKWIHVLLRIPKITQVIINGDDPQLAYIGGLLSSPVQYFGLNNPDLFLSRIDHATDSIFCPKCGSRLTFGGVYFSHLGKWACGQCGFVHPHLNGTDKDVITPLDGVYNRYNAIASMMVGKVLGVADQEIADRLQTFTPAFGRMESIVYKGKKMCILLSKNPTGLNESLRAVLGQKKQGPLLFVLNDRIPDGRDVSWIWDSDIEMLQDYDWHIGVAGDRVYDMALRIKYAGVSDAQYTAYEDVKQAIDEMAHLTKVSEEVSIFTTYSAMLEVRKILTGKKMVHA